MSLLRSREVGSHLRERQTPAVAERESYRGTAASSLRELRPKTDEDASTRLVHTRAATKWRGCGLSRHQPAILIRPPDFFPSSILLPPVCRTLWGIRGFETCNEHVCEPCRRQRHAETQLLPKEASRDRVERRDSFVKASWVMSSPSSGFYCERPSLSF